MGIREQCSECDKVTKRCRCTKEHTIHYVVCDECKNPKPVEAPAPEPPADDPEPETVPEPEKALLNMVHSPKLQEDGTFLYALDSSRSPAEIRAFAAGMDYGVRKHLDLFIEVLRLTMDKHEHYEATSLLSVLAESEERLHAESETARKRLENAQAIGVGKVPPHDV